MTVFIVCWCLALFWAAINVGHMALEKRWPATLDRFNRNGISIGFLSVTWQTTCFNEWFNSFSPKRSLSRCQYYWYTRYFTIGVWLTIAMFPYACYTILCAVLQTTDIFGQFALTTGSNEATSSPTLKAQANLNTNSGFMIVVPGVSVPFHECIYFFLAVAISSVIHELGHALAANRHRLHIETVGISLFVCLPITFVSMQSTEQLKNSKQFEIVSAGLLNNAVLCFLTIICFILNPLSLLYTSANGLIVTNVDPLSSLSSGPNALQKYEVIKNINNYPVASLNEWTTQLNSIADQQHGLCVPQDFLEKYKSSISLPCDFDECCANDNRRLCFLLHTTEVEESELHSSCNVHQQLVKSNLKHYYASQQAYEFDLEIIANNFTKNHRKICLPARQVTEVATQFCNDSTNCVHTYYGPSFCLWPYSNQPQTRLIVVEVESKQANILFWGPAAELYQAVSLSSIRPKLGIIPIMAIDQLNTFYRYLFSISFSILLFNLLPYDPFDGYQMFLLTSVYLFRDSVRQRILYWTHFTAAVLVLLCVFAALLRLRLQYQL